MGEIPPSRPGRDKRQWVDQIADDWPATHGLINAVKEQEPGMAAFMAFLGVRLIECKRALKETCSIYVHLDPARELPLRDHLGIHYSR